jgi:hypothetical protein
VVENANTSSSESLDALENSNNQSESFNDGEKNNTSKETPNIQLLKTKEESDSVKNNVLENLKSVENELPNLKSDDKDEVLLATKNINEALSKISDKMSGGFESMMQAIGSINTESNREPIQQEQDQGFQQQNTDMQNPKISQKNYVDEYRKSLRTNLPLKSLMGISTTLKGNNIGSYI